MKIKPVAGLNGDITVPGDKSISHRALILSSLADGVSHINGLLEGEDCLNTLKAVKRLGADVQKQSAGEYVIQGQGREGLREPENIIDCGNSGTCLRLLSGLLTAQNFYSVLTGDSSLRQRPLNRVIEPLSRMGGRLWSRKGGLAPLSIQGSPLQGINYKLPVASAQVKSCLLLASLYARGKTVLTEPGPSRDHTERMLANAGINLDIEGLTITLSEKDKGDLKPFDIEIPGDISSAAYWIAAALITDNSELVIKNVGINPTRSGFLEIIEKMGADVSLLNKRSSGGEPVADIKVKSSKLTGTEIKGSIIPRLIDEIPILAVIAVKAEGKTIIRDAEELRVKETDRIQALARQLPRLNINLKTREDGLIIEGPQEFRGGCDLKSYQDHRIAMSLAVAGMAADKPVQISGEASINTSYPEFFDTLNHLCD